VARVNPNNTGKYRRGGELLAGDIAPIPLFDTGGGAEPRCRREGGGGEYNTDGGLAAQLKPCGVNSDSVCVCDCQF